MNAIDELARGSINDEQIRIVKNNLQRELYHVAVTPSSLGQRLGDSFINTNDLALHFKAMKHIEQTTKDDIRRVVSNYILDGKFTSVRLLPQKS